MDGAETPKTQVVLRVERAGEAYSVALIDSGGTAHYSFMGTGEAYGAMWATVKAGGRFEVSPMVAEHFRAWFDNSTPQAQA